MLTKKIEDLNQVQLSQAKIRLGEIVKHFQQKSPDPIVLTWYNKPLMVVLSLDSYLSSLLSSDGHQE